MFNTFLLYRLLTLGAMLASALFLFYKYVFGYVKEQIERKRTYFYNLKKEKESLEKQKMDVENEIIEEEVVAKNLEKKLIKWKKVFKEQQELYNEEEEKIFENLEKKIDKQRKQLEIFYFFQRDFSKVLDKVQEKVKSDFQKKDKEKEFLSKIIGYMK